MRARRRVQRCCCCRSFSSDAGGTYVRCSLHQQQQPPPHDAFIAPPAETSPAPAPPRLDNCALLPRDAPFCPPSKLYYGGGLHHPRAQLPCDSGAGVVLEWWTAARPCALCFQLSRATSERGAKNDEPDYGGK